MKMLLKSVICGTRDQCTDALFTVDLSTITGWENKKKQKQKTKMQNKRTKTQRQQSFESKRIHGIWAMSIVSIQLRHMHDSTHSVVSQKVTLKWLFQ